MSRTEEVMRSGARSLGGDGGGPPFIKWSDAYTWVEGRVLELWEGRYGLNAKLSVTRASDNAQAKTGDGLVKVEPGMDLNVGLNYAALDGVSHEQVGAVVHLAFEGWEESKGGNRYRVFKAFELEESEYKKPIPPENPAPASSISGDSPEEPGFDESDLPF